MPAKRATQAGPRVNDTRWRPDAKCRDSDPELFYTDSEKARKYAKAICAGCPVREACLGYAMALEAAISGAAGRRHGIWGGLTANERWALANPKQAEQKRKAKATYDKNPAARARKRETERARRARGRQEDGEAA